MGDEDATNQACQLQIDRDMEAQGNPERETREEYIELPFEVERDFIRDPDLICAINQRQWISVADPPSNEDELVARELFQTNILQLVVKNWKLKNPKEPVFQMFRLLARIV